jgi:hypothetical protein
MVIDFNKPIQYIADLSKEVKILFHDEHSVLIEFEDNLRSPTENRHIYTFDKFNLFFENVPEEPKKIKGFIGVFTNNDGMYRFTQGYQTKESLLEFSKDNKIHTIVPIEFVEGEGLQ